ncbi:MAG TPA: hypothetical protein VGI84_09350 [Pseudonocardiaceae bacterium]|jgi:hypothetical protein
MISAGAVLALDSLSGYFVVLAWSTPQPSGPADTDAVDGALWASSLGALVAFVDLLLVAGLVRGRVLPWWWLVWPAVMVVTAVTRFHMVPRF